MSFWICALGRPASEGGVKGDGVGDGPPVWAIVEGVRIRKRMRRTKPAR
jgi:hypothetical protein